MVFATTQTVTQVNQVWIKLVEFSIGALSQILNRSLLAAVLLFVFGRRTSVPVLHLGILAFLSILGYGWIGVGRLQDVIGVAGVGNEDVPRPPRFSGSIIGVDGTKAAAEHVSSGILELCLVTKDYSLNLSSRISVMGFEERKLLRKTEIEIQSNEGFKAISERI